jgi:hypothetical protein
MRTFSLDRPIVIRYSNTSSSTTNTLADTNSIIGKALVLEKSECPRFILATHPFQLFETSKSSAQEIVHKITYTISN